MCTLPLKHHRFPAEVIGYGVWPHFRFSLSFVMSRNCSRSAG